MEAAKHTYEFVRRTSKPSSMSHSSSMTRSPPRKRPVAFEKGRGARPSYKKESKSFSVLPPYPCGMKKATALLRQWVKESVIRLPYVELLPSQADQKDVKFILFIVRWSIFIRFVIFRWMFDAKGVVIIPGGILFQNKGAINIMSVPSQAQQQWQGQRPCDDGDLCRKGWRMHSHAARERAKPYRMTQPM